MDLDPAFSATLRDLLAALAAGSESSLPSGGGLSRFLREASPLGPRAAVGALADRWFRSASPDALTRSDLPLLNRPDLGDAEKLHAVLREHVVAQRRWQELSSNESTFYRFRRAAVAAFVERAWSEVVLRPLPSNRPVPEYTRFVGRQREVAELLRLLAAEPGGAVVGVEGPGGSGKTALLHAVADACAAAARAWQPTPIPDSGTPPLDVPLFDAIVWAAPAGRLDLGVVLDAIIRTLDYPGLLARAVEDRRQAVRDRILARHAVLVVVDDVDQADPAVLPFLADLPGRGRALVAARRRLPPEVRAIAPRPLTLAEVRELLEVEAQRQGAPEIGAAFSALVDEPRLDGLDPLVVAARYPLLATWAVGQLRRGQTLERVRERLARAEGEVFDVMFAASVAGLTPPARHLLALLPLLPAPADRATVLAAGGSHAAPALDELLETSLLEVTGSGITDAARRYGIHAVTRGFAQAHLACSESDERAAVARLAHHFADRAESWGGPAANWRRYGQLEAELPNLVAVVEAATRLARDRDADPPGATFDRAILTLAHGMRNVFWFSGSWATGLTLFHRAIEAARRLDDPLAEGWNTYRLGALHYELGTAGFVEAVERARQADDLLQTAQDPRGQGHARRLLGRALRARGSTVEAESYLSEAENLLAHHGHGDDVAIVLASRADLLRHTGRLEEAERLYLDVLDRGLDDAATEATVRTDLGEIAIAHGDLPRADERFAAARALAEPSGARAVLARCGLGEAQVAHALGDLPRAAALARTAADWFERLGDSERAQSALTLLARTRGA